MTRIHHNEQAQQINIFDERFYTLDNEHYYPSVTTVLEALPETAQLKVWKKSVGFNADIILERAANEGSNIHDTIETLLIGGVVLYHNYNKTEWQCICRFVEFWTRFQPQLIATEQIIVSINLRLGGTIDIVCMIDGKRWLIDAKSSNAIHESHEIQIAAYATMWNEQHPDLPIDCVGILHLKALTRGEDKKGLKMQGKGWQIVTFDTPYQETYEKVFIPLRAVWDHCNPDYKPAIITLPDRLQLNNQ